MKVNFMSKSNIEETIRKATIARDKAKWPYINAGRPNSGPLLDAYIAAVDALDHAELLFKKE